jgi:creatinine amidohydrolase/Fe(II)-dependent formamide hydrolase-like protein
MRVAKWTIPPKGGHMDKRTGIYLQNMTGREVDERLAKNDILIVPLGATETHGAHAPLGEDVFLVCRMAEEVAARTGCTVAQPVWYGSHPYHHLGMQGTVVIPEEIFAGYVRAMIAGFWNLGFRKQILLNGHGQEYVIPTAMHQFAKKYRVPSLLLLVNWYHPIRDHFRLASQGGPYETPFIHGDEVETSWSLALFPELIDMKHAPDNTVQGFLPGDHIDKAGNLLNRPINWYSQVGAGPIEVKAYIEGVVGRSSIARAEKAYEGVEQLLDYLERLVADVHRTFPPGKLPPVEMVTERDPRELEAVLKGPRAGGKSIYSLGYPP